MKAGERKAGVLFLRNIYIRDRVESMGEDVKTKGFSWFWDGFRMVSLPFGGLQGSGRVDG